MSTYTQPSPSPVEETLTHKTDVLDWSEIESQPCDLEFRTEFHLSLRDTVQYTFQIAIQFIVVSLVAWLLARPIAVALAPWLDHWPFAVLSVVVGVAWALAVDIRRSNLTQQEPTPVIQPGTLIRTFLPPLVWQAITLSTHLDRVKGAFVYYVAVTLPFAVFFFDRFATHVVHWMTVSPNSDYASKTLGRQVWTHRLLGATPLCVAPRLESSDDTPESWHARKQQLPSERHFVFHSLQQVVSGYRWGILWLAAATLTPLAIGNLLDASVRTLLGLQLIGGMFCGLTFAVLLRIESIGTVVPLFFRMLSHWFFFGWKQPLPPWIFHSPCGNWFTRRAFALVTVGLLAVPITCLAASSFRGLMEAQTPAPVRFDSWLWLAPTALVCLITPPISFCLIGILLTGNVLAAYHRTFEIRRSEPTVTRVSRRRRSLFRQ